MACQVCHPLVRQHQVAGPPCTRTQCVIGQDLPHACTSAPGHQSLFVRTHVGGLPILSPVCAAAPYRPLSCNKTCQMSRRLCTSTVLYAILGLLAPTPVTADNSVLCQTQANDFCYKHQMAPMPRPPPPLPFSMQTRSVSECQLEPAGGWHCLEGT